MPTTLYVRHEGLVFPRIVQGGNTHGLMVSRHKREKAVTDRTRELETRNKRFALRTRLCVPGVPGVPFPAPMGRRHYLCFGHKN